MGRIPQTPRRRRLTPEELEARGQLRLLVECPARAGARPALQALKRPFWTENKARLIERYLYYFVLVTRHGTYIDGFAGPQDSTHPDNWAAKRVLESDPKWLRHFLLCELKPRPYVLLQRLRDEQPPIGRGKSKRTIDLFQGDFNERVNEILSSPHITEKEATFCLVDQRSFECHWATIETIARHKRTGPKVELFYFLAAGWFGRAFRAIKNRAILERWWGRDDWIELANLSDRDRALLVCDRFQDGLGYRYAAPFPIFSRQRGSRIMYFMVHASDHDEAPKLMTRAYNRAIYPKESAEQLQLLLREL